MLILVTILSSLLALIMSVVAWRVLRSERERSAARVDALARDIHRSSIVDELPLRAESAEPGVAGLADAGLADAGLADAGLKPCATAEMFTVAAGPAASGSRWGLAVAVGAFVVASVAAMVVVFGGDAPGTKIAIASATEQTAAGRPSAVPLELVALSHDRDGNQLTVRGIVRNPASGTEMNGLVAVVVLFNQDGNAVATARAAVAAPALIAGGESRFVVIVPEASEVARYRVSFRSDERVIAHLDKRNAP